MHKLIFAVAAFALVSTTSLADADEIPQSIVEGLAVQYVHGVLPRLPSASPRSAPRR